MLARIFIVAILVAILVTACGPEGNTDAPTTDAPNTLGNLSPSELQELCTDLSDAVIGAQDAGVDNATILRVYADGAGISLSQAQAVIRLCYNALQSP